MTRLGLFLICGLAACSSAAPPRNPAPEPIVFSLGEIETDANGRCFGIARSPDRFETVIEQIEVVAETRTANGTLINPAIFRNEARRVRVPSTDSQRFQTLCPPDYTPELVASLQRALAARGHFIGEITGVMDAATSAAVQKYQDTKGLNSPLLASTTARDLGLIIAENE